MESGAIFTFINCAPFCEDNQAIIGSTDDFNFPIWGDYDPASYLMPNGVTRISGVTTISPKKN